jgi:hypothetical protein
MANSGLYTADDYYWVSKSTPATHYVRRNFSCTIATALAQTSAAAFLAGDIILLAPLPQRCWFTDYRVYTPQMDSNVSPTLAVNVGDTQVLAGAVTGIVSTAVTLPATIGNTFTLTATASTSSFASTNGLLLVGNILVLYESLSGSTFVNCRSYLNKVTIQPGWGIQQCGNLSAYQAASTFGQVASVLNENYAESSANTFVNSTVTLNSVPVFMPNASNTAAAQSNNTGPTLGNIGPFYYFLMQISTAAATQATTGIITGWVGYTMTGQPG